MYCFYYLTLRYIPFPTAKMLSPNANSANTAHAMPAANAMLPSNVKNISFQLLISHLPAVLAVGVFLVLT